MRFFGGRANFFRRAMSSRRRSSRFCTPEHINCTMGESGSLTLFAALDRMSSFACATFVSTAAPALVLALLKTDGTTFSGACATRFWQRRVGAGPLRLKGELCGRSTETVGWLSSFLFVSVSQRIPRASVTVELSHRHIVRS